MKGLTKAEEQIMQIIWKKEKCLVRDIIETLGDPDIPHSTVSSVVRILEKKGFVGHKAYGKTHEYFPLISKNEYRKSHFGGMLKNYFDGKVENLLSFMLREKKLTKKELSELKKFIDEQ